MKEMFKITIFSRQNDSDRLLNEQVTTEKETGFEGFNNKESKTQRSIIKNIIKKELFLDESTFIEKIHSCEFTHTNCPILHKIQF